MRSCAIFLVFVACFCSGYGEEKTFLASMRKSEFLNIIKCVSNSRDPILCAKYGACEKELPPRVLEAHQKCQKEHVGLEVLRCSKHEPLFKSPAIPAKIFDCVCEMVHVLSPMEKKVMAKFEACAKKLEEESCKISGGHQRHRMRPFY